MSTEEKAGCLRPQPDEDCQQLIDQGPSQLSPAAPAPVEDIRSVTIGYE